MRHILTAITLAVALAGCAATQPETAADLSAAYNVAAAAEAAYAAHPGADPKVVQQMKQLLAAAQAAEFSWSGSQTQGNQAALNATIAALIAYEASAHLT